MTATKSVKRTVAPRTARRRGESAFEVLVALGRPGDDAPIAAVFGDDTEPAFTLTGPVAISLRVLARLRKRSVQDTLVRSLRRIAAEGVSL